MSGRKLVSVVTATWNRHEMLLEAIENVRQQTYRPLEHVIVADGPDPEARRLTLDSVKNGNARNVPIRFQELGFHSSTVLTNSISAAPFMVAQLLARGEYQMWMADDERCLVPDHIERLVGLLEQYDADFAYPRVQMTWPDSEQVMVIGGTPPKRGQFTHCLYRRDLLDKGMLFRTHVGSGSDADALERVMAGPGVRWAYLPEVTFTHQVDKVVMLGLLAGAFMQGWF